MRRNLELNINENAEKKEYLCQVTVKECRNLQTKNRNGLCDPFVKITCANKQPQLTDPLYGTTQGAWNQSFTFSNVISKNNSKLFLSETELEKFEILIEIFDLSAFTSNTLVGSYSVGLSTLYKSMNHEFYNTWLPLSNPEQLVTGNENPHKVPFIILTKRAIYLSLAISSGQTTLLQSTT